VLKEIGKLDALTALIVYNEHMEAIPREWGKLRNLQVLQIIQESGIESIESIVIEKQVDLPEELMKLENLLYLDIKRPKYLIQTIPDSIHKLSKLKGLIMTCSIKCIPELITKLQGLELLILIDSGDNWEENLSNLLEYLKTFAKLKEIRYYSGDLNIYLKNHPQVVDEIHEKISRSMSPSLEKYRIGMVERVISMIDQF
jgi:hypothetical protein